MNCKVNYKEEQARKGDKQQANAKVGIRKGTATGRVTKCGPIQPLQECVWRSTAKRPRGTAVRCPVGVSRLQTRLTKQEKTTGPMNSQWDPPPRVADRGERERMNKQISLLINNLGIQCHVLSIVELVSSQHLYSIQFLLTEVWKHTYWSTLSGNGYDHQ